MEQHYFSGQGKLFAGKRNRAGVVDSYYWVGNCTELLIETEQAYLDHKENYTGAKIIDLRVLTGSEVNVTITLENLKRENWATAYKGALTLPIGATVTDETYLAPTEGNYLVLAKKNVTAVTVINPLAGGAAFSPVTDYQHLPPSNLVYVPTNSTMADTVVVIDYQSGASELMTAIGQPEEDLFLIFEGLNTVRDMERVVVNLFRVRFSTTNQLQLISDELSRFQLIGKAIYDEFRAEEGGYLTINYAKDFILFADKETVFNGDTFTVNFSADTPGTYPYTITGVNSADIGGASLTGTFTGGTDSVTFTMTNDSDTKTFNLALDNGEASANVKLFTPKIDPETYVITYIDLTSLGQPTIDAINSAVVELRALLAIDVYGSTALADKYVKAPIGKMDERYLLWAGEDNRDLLIEPNKVLVLSFVDEVNRVFDSSPQSTDNSYHYIPRNTSVEPTNLWTADFNTFVAAYLSFELFNCLVFSPTGSPSTPAEDAFNPHLIDVIAGNNGYPAMSSYNWTGKPYWNENATGAELYDAIIAYLFG